MNLIGTGRSGAGARLTRRAALMTSGGAALAACVPGMERGGSVPERAPAGLRFWGGPYSVQRQEQLAAWNERHPESHVQFESVPEVGQGAAALRRLTAATAARTAPDLLDFDRFQVRAFANWRALRALDEFARRDGMALTDFLAGAVTEATGVDGKLYALPSSADTRLLFWNKESFAVAGLDPEKGPETWDELREAAVRLTRRGSAGEVERLGFHSEEGQASLHLFAWQAGGAFQSVDGKRGTLPRAENAVALQFLVDLMEAQAGWEGARAARGGWGRPHPFVTGQLALLYQIPDWMAGVVGGQRRDLAFGVGAPPRRRSGDAPLSWSGGYGYVMGRETAAPGAAWAVARWLVSAEAIRLAARGEKARATAGGGVYLPGSAAQPELDGALRREYRTGITAFDATLDAAAALLPRSRTREPSLAAAELWDGILAAQGRAVSRQQPADRALEEENVAVQRALDQAWALVGGRA